MEEKSIDIDEVLPMAREISDMMNKLSTKLGIPVHEVILPLLTANAMLAIKQQSGNSFFDQLENFWKSVLLLEPKLEADFKSLMEIDEEELSDYEKEAKRKYIENKKKKENKK